MRARALASLALGAALASACGGGDDGAVFGGSGAAGSTGGAGTGGATAGTGATGGAPAGTGGATTGGTSSGGDGGPSSGGGGAGGATKDFCEGRGTRTPGGACYIPCTYDPGRPPYYEEQNGSCSSIGWRCTALQYCALNLKCQGDAICADRVGPGLTCVTAGPLAGECALGCSTDADCPDSGGATPSPYACKAIDTGNGVINVCRF